MGIVQRQAIKNFVFSYLGTALGFINKALLFPILLQESEVGLVEILMAAMVMGSEISLLGLNKIILRFFPFFYQNKNREGDFIGLITFYGFMGFILLTLLFFLFYDFIYGLFYLNSPLFAEHLFFIPLLIFAYSSFRILSGLSQSLLKSVLPHFVYQVVLRILLMLLLTVYSMKVIPLDTFIWGVILIHFVPSIVIFVYLLWLDKLHFSFSLGIWRKKMFRLVIFYGLYASLSNAVLIVIQKLDISMLASLKGEANAGVYSNAFYLALLVIIPFRALSPILNPLFARKAKEKQANEIQSLYDKASLNNLLIGGLVMVGLWLNLEDYYRLTPNLSNYIGGYQAALWLTSGILINGTFSVQRIIIINSRHYRFDLIANFSALVFVIVGNYLLIPHYGETGAAITTFGGLIIVNILCSWYVYSRMGIRPFQTNMLKITGLIAITIMIISLLPDHANPYINIMITSILTIAIYGASSYFLKMSDEVNAFVDRLLFPKKS